MSGLPAEPQACSHTHGSTGNARGAILPIISIRPLQQQESVGEHAGRLRGWWGVLHPFHCLQLDLFLLSALAGPTWEKGKIV